jgi:hypothetical protein
MGKTDRSNQLQSRAEVLPCPRRRASDSPPRRRSPSFGFIASTTSPSRIGVTSTASTPPCSPAGRRSASRTARAALEPRSRRASDSQDRRIATPEPTSFRAEGARAVTGDVEGSQDKGQTNHPQLYGDETSSSGEALGQPPPGLHPPGPDQHSVRPRPGPRDPRAELGLTADPGWSDDRTLAHAEVAGGPDRDCGGRGDG